MNVESIKPNLMVHAKDMGATQNMNGIHVGTVDHMEGNQWIKLKKSDSDDGEHHWIPADWVERADETAIYLSKTVDEFQEGLLNDNPVGTH